MLSFMPELVEQLMPVSFSQMATSAGRIAVAYDDPIVLLLVTVWAISRGSDAVSGELNRGTMEMVLAQPVTRLGVLGPRPRSRWAARRCWPRRPCWARAWAWRRITLEASRLADGVRAGGLEPVRHDRVSGRADHDGFVGRQLPLAHDRHRGRLFTPCR